MKKIYLDTANKNNPIVILEKFETAKRLECMKKNISFSIPIDNGYEIYIANLDGTQGIWSRILNGEQTFANERGEFR